MPGGAGPGCSSNSHASQFGVLVGSRLTAMIWRSPTKSSGSRRSKPIWKTGSRACWDRVSRRPSRDKSFAFSQTSLLTVKDPDERTMASVSKLPVADLRRQPGMMARQS